ARGCHATDPSGVSSSFSSNTRNKKRQNRPGEILKRPPRCIVETGDTPIRARGCHATAPSGVSSSFSSNTRNKKRQNRPGEILKGPPRCIVETVETHQRIRSRQQAPPIRNSFAKHVEHIPTQTEVIRVRT